MSTYSAYCMASREEQALELRPSTVLYHVCMPTCLRTLVHLACTTCNTCHVLHTQCVLRTPTYPAIKFYPAWHARQSAAPTVPTYPYLSPAIQFYPACMREYNIVDKPATHPRVLDENVLVPHERVVLNVRVARTARPRCHRLVHLRQLLQQTLDLRRLGVDLRGFRS